MIHSMSIFCFIFLLLFALPLATVYYFVYLQEHLKKTLISNYYFFKSCFLTLQEGMKEMGRRLRHKLCLTMRCEAIRKTPVYIKYEFHTIKQLTFPKRKGNGQLTMGSSVYIFLLKMKEMLAEVFLKGQEFATHLFIKAFTHMEALLTYLNTGVAEGLRGPINLAQTARKWQNQPWTCFCPHSLNNIGEMEKIWSRKRVRTGTLNFWLVASIIFLEMLRLQVMMKA